MRDTVRVCVANKTSSESKEKCPTACLLCTYRHKDVFRSVPNFPGLKQPKHMQNTQTAAFRLLLGTEMRRVEEETHENPAQRAGNGDGGDPGDDEQADTLEIDGLQCAVAEADTDGGAGNAHRCRHGERELRKDQYSDGGAHLHRAATAGGVVCDLVTHDYC